MYTGIKMKRYSVGDVEELGIIARESTVCPFTAGQERANHQPLGTSS